MFKQIKLQTDIYILYYKYFLLNNYFNDYLNDNISYSEYYNNYNTHYMNQIQLYNNL